MNGRSAFPVLTLRQASFDNLKTGQGNGLERITLFGKIKEKTRGKTAGSGAATGFTGLVIPMPTGVNSKKYLLSNFYRKFSGIFFRMDPDCRRALVSPPRLPSF
jgi:hypothetical protein